MPGGAVPKKKASHAKQGRRRSHVRLHAPELVACAYCHQPKLPHHVCQTCGMYHGRMVIDIRARERKQHE